MLFSWSMMETAGCRHNLTGSRLIKLEPHPEDIAVYDLRLSETDFDLCRFCTRSKAAWATDRQRWQRKFLRSYKQLWATAFRLAFLTSLSVNA